MKNILLIARDKIEDLLVKNGRPKKITFDLRSYDSQADAPQITTPEGKYLVSIVWFDEPGCLKVAAHSFNGMRGSVLQRNLAEKMSAEEHDEVMTLLMKTKTRMVCIRFGRKSCKGAADPETRWSFCAFCIFRKDRAEALPGGNSRWFV